MATVSLSSSPFHFSWVKFFVAKLMSEFLCGMENNGGFNVLVNPNVDYAFIVALLMIVKDMNCCDETQNSTNTNKTISALKIISLSF
ncbi:hypothetical protein ACSQ67_016231 [Phaseolus vulgaris]